MDDSRNKLMRQTLKKHGYSLTAPRLLIFELLTHSEPQSMRRLLERSGNKIDRASLYRTIRLFENIGVAQRVVVGWKYKIELTDIFSDHHHHITCLNCGKLTAIEENLEIEELIQKIAGSQGLKPVRHQLEIQGYCRDCQARHAKTTATLRPVSVRTGSAQASQWAR